MALKAILTSQSALTAVLMDTYERTLGLLWQVYGPCW